MADEVLDEMIAERSHENPAFHALLDAAIRRQQVEAEPVADGAPEAT